MTESTPAGAGVLSMPKRDVLGDKVAGRLSAPPPPSSLERRVLCVLALPLCRFINVRRPEAAKRPEAN